jgi:hypothetical protein
MRRHRDGVDVEVLDGYQTRKHVSGHVGGR